MYGVGCRDIVSWGSGELPEIPGFALEKCWYPTSHLIFSLCKFGAIRLVVECCSCPPPLHHWCEEGGGQARYLLIEGGGQQHFEWGEKVSLLLLF